MILPTKTMMGHDGRRRGLCAIQSRGISCAMPRTLGLRYFFRRLKSSRCIYVAFEATTHFLVAFATSPLCRSLKPYLDMFLVQVRRRRYRDLP
jgi:hypothetical protein